MRTLLDRYEQEVTAYHRLYPSKLPVTAVHLMNNDVLPTFEAHEATIETVLSDNGREFCEGPISIPTSCSCNWETLPIGPHG